MQDLLTKNNHKMKIYNSFLLLLLFTTIIIVPIRAQVIAEENLLSDSLLWQAHEFYYEDQPEKAIVLYEKAAALYQSQSSPKEAEANYYLAVVANYIEKWELSELYYSKNNKFLNLNKEKEPWAFSYACKSKINVFKKYNQKDSVAAYNDKIFVVLEHKGTNEIINLLKANVAIHLCEYYYTINNTELAIQFLAKAKSYNNNLKNKNNRTYWETQRYINFYISLTEEKHLIAYKNNFELLNQIKIKKPNYLWLMLYFHKNNTHIFRSINDTNLLKIHIKTYKEFVLKNYSKQSNEWAVYQSDVAVLYKKKLNQRKKALVMLNEAIEFIEQQGNADAKRRLCFIYLRAGFTYTEEVGTLEAQLAARAVFYKALEYASNGGLQKINPNQLPDFSNDTVACINLLVAVQILNLIYGTYKAEYKDDYEQKHIDKMKPLADAALSIYYRMMKDAQGEENFIQIFQLYKNIKNTYSDMYIYAYLKKPEIKYLELLMQNYEDLKAATTQKHLNENRQLALAGVSEKEILAYQNSKKQSQNFAATYESLSKESRKKEAVAVLNSKITVDKELVKIEKQFIEKYPLYQKLKNESPTIKIKDIQSQLKPNVAFLYYLTFENKELLIIIQKDTAYMQNNKEFFANPEYNTSILYNLVQQNPSEITNVKEWQANFVKHYRYWGNGLLPSNSVLSVQKIEELIICPHTFTYSIPFELLLTEDCKDDVGFTSLPYAIKKYSIQYVNSAGLWLKNKETSLQNNQNGKILAFAPTYQRGIKNKFRTGSMKMLRDNLSELSGTTKELDNLSNYFYGDYFNGTVANEALFKSKIKEQYSILHLAMHGIADEENPTLSALAFSETVDTTEDNFLNAYEIAQLQQNSQLIVLSACETAKGQQQGGEGTMSIARYFMYGGAAALVATRWQVNDQTTAFIMQNFYKYIYEGKSIKQAMRQAQLNYLQQSAGAASYPFYWAAFMNIGDTDKVIYLANKNWAIKYYIIIACALLAIGGVWYFKFRKKE